eukprot:7274726-Prymnesium_polylepis.1
MVEYAEMGFGMDKKNNPWKLYAMNKAEYFHGRRSRSTRGYGAGDPDPDLAEIDDPFSYRYGMRPRSSGGRRATVRLSVAAPCSARTHVA